MTKIMIQQEQSTESQDAQFIIELVGRNDPDVNTNILIDKTI